MPTRIALTTLGTRGDVQPFVALALALQARGHLPVIIVNRNLAPLVQRAGIPVVAADCDTDALYHAEQGRRMLKSGHTTKLVQRGMEWFAQARPALEHAILEGTDGADVVISGFLVDDIAASAAEYHKARFVLSNFAPYVRTSTEPNLLVTRTGPGWQWFNLLTHQLADRVAYGPKAADEARFRQRLGLPPLRHSVLRRIADAGGPYLGAWSAAIAPRPVDWGPEMRVTGAWAPAPVLREAWGEVTMPEHLQEFLANGPPPIFLTFGSMPTLDPEALVTYCRDIARRRQTRVLLGVRAPVPSDALVHALPEPVDHTRLFPHCAGVIHHGGAGSTLTACAAGVPNFAISLFADGPYWGHRLAALGVGGHLPYAKLTAQTLDRAIRRLLDPTVRARAQALATRIEPPQVGVNAAAEFLTQ